MRTRSHMRYPWSARGALALLVSAACTDGRSPTGPQFANELPSLDVAATAADPGGSFCNAAGFTFPDGSIANVVRSSLSVSGLGTGPFKVTVTLNGISHQNVSQLDVLVVGPTNVMVVLLGNVSTGADFANTTITFDDDASSSVPTLSNSSAIIPDGTYRPRNFGGVIQGPIGPRSSVLSAFSAANPNGTWRLYVWDEFLGSGSGGSVSGGWCVTFASLNTAPVSAAGGPYTGVEGSPVAFDGTGSSDPDGEPIASYAWDFGDGSTGTGPAPEHAYAAGGTYTVKLTVADAAGASAEATTTATISDVAPEATFVAPATADEGTSVTISLTSPSVTEARYAFDCGDGSGLGPIGEESSATCPFADDGEVTVKGRVLDPPMDDLFTEYSAVVAVANIAPVVTAIRLPLDPVAVGTSIEVSATFTDVGSVDTHTGTFDLNDGAPPVIGSVVESDGSGTASAVVTYSQAGVHVVRVAVTDDDGASAERSSALDVPSYVVVYDPAGGFVTGGGWIWSPAGSYVANPALEGKASFGFVARYQKGASTPGGGTEFQFRLGSLSFRSTSYEWLVIAGARAKYKGEGSIDDVNGYGFMVTAIDGDVSRGGDAFRIKIWELATGSIVYDNVRGEDDASDATTSLGGGSIVIHQ